MNARTFVGLLALAIAAAVSGAFLQRWLTRRREDDAQLKAATILSSLLNAANHDVRSLELGRWFLRELRGVLAPGASGVRCQDTGAVNSIAARVPGANDVSRAEHARHLAALAAMACATDDPLYALHWYEARALPALAATGTYAERSKTALPSALP